MNHHPKSVARDPQSAPGNIGLPAARSRGHRQEGQRHQGQQQRSRRQHHHRHRSPPINIVGAGLRPAPSTPVHLNSRRCRTPPRAPAAAAAPAHCASTTPRVQTPRALPPAGRASAANPRARSATNDNSPAHLPQSARPPPPALRPDQTPSKPPPRDSNQSPETAKSRQAFRKERRSAPNPFLPPYAPAHRTPQSTPATHTELAQQDPTPAPVPAPQARDESAADPIPRGFAPAAKSAPPQRPHAPQHATPVSPSAPPSRAPPAPAARAPPITAPAATRLRTAQAATNRHPQSPRNPH